MFTSLSELSDSRKEELVASLATIVCGSSSVDGITAEALAAVADKSGNKLSESYASLFSAVATAAGGLDPFCGVPGAGGGGGGGGGGDAAVPAAKVEEKAEEEEVDMGGGIDMFGGDEGGGDGY